jgi:hypothetical protein
MRKGNLIAACTLALTVIAGPALAQGAAGDSAAVEQRAERPDRGDRVERRLDRRGDVVDRRLDRAARRAHDADRDRLARGLDRRGDGIDRRMDRRGRQRDRQIDRRTDRRQDRSL